MKILIGYDGSSGSNDALESLTTAGLPARAEVVVVTVAEIWLPSPPSHGLVSLREAEGKKAESVLAVAARACESLARQFPEWKAKAEAYAGSPALALLKKADEWRPDLIVVGSHSHLAARRVLLGSVAQKIVTEARCTVRVGRARTAEHTRREIQLVLGIDGSSGSSAATEWIGARSWPTGSALKLVTTTGPFTAIPPASDWMLPMLQLITPEEREDAFAEARRWHERARETLRPTRLAVSSVIKEGDPKYVLVSEAAAGNADSIVVGCAGLSRFERLVLGSVSSAVVAHAPCSVDVVRVASNER
jgi:nucleotide-binding universal stress UspA family protein